MKKLCAITVLLLVALHFAAAQTSVQPYQPGVTEDGVTYFLPRTALRVSLTCRRTHYSPGAYAAYAAHYLRLNDVTQSEHDVWQIESAGLQTYGVADPSQAYTIRMKPKTSAPLVGLAADGRLLAVNAEAKPEPVLTGAGVQRVEKPRVDAADFQSQDILSAGSVAKMAELTADEIYDIRENRALLTKGQADFMPKDGEQLRLMLGSLDVQEAALLSLFKGTETEEVHTFVFDLTPAAEGEASRCLARFSKWLGVVDADDLSGEALVLDVTPLESLPERADAAQGGKQKKPVEDLRYIVPGRASAKLRLGEQELASITFPAAQMGYVEHLGGDLFNKKFTTRVWLSPTTGGIVQIEGEPQS